MTRTNKSGVNWSDREAVKAYKRQQRHKAGARRALTQEDWSRIYRAYIGGEPMAAIARREQIAPRTVWYIYERDGKRKR